MSVTYIKMIGKKVSTPVGCVPPACWLGTTPAPFQSILLIGGSKGEGGRQGRVSPPVSKFFLFHAVYGKNLKNNSNFGSWPTPLGKILDPPLLLRAAITLPPTFAAPPFYSTPSWQHLPPPNSTPSHERNESQTCLKTLPCTNFVCGR